MSNGLQAVACCQQAIKYTANIAYLAQVVTAPVSMCSYVLCSILKQRIFFLLLYIYNKGIRLYLNTFITILIKSLRIPCMESIWTGPWIPYGFHSRYGLKKWLGAQPKNSPYGIHGLGGGIHPVHMESIWNYPGSVKTSLRLGIEECADDINEVNFKSFRSCHGKCHSN